MSKKLKEGANNPYTAIVEDALQGSGSGDRSGQEPAEKRRPGRPTKQDAVKRTDHRLSVYINNDLYEYWTDRNRKTNGNMAAVINRLLYEEMERLKNG